MQMGKFKLPGEATRHSSNESTMTSRNETTHQQRSSAASVIKKRPVIIPEAPEAVKEASQSEQEEAPQVESEPLSPAVEVHIENPFTDEDDDETVPQSKVAEARTEPSEDFLDQLAEIGEPDEEDDYVAPSPVQTKTLRTKRALPERGEDRLREHTRGLTRGSRIRLSDTDKAILSFLDRVRYARKTDLWHLVDGTARPNPDTAPSLRAVEERANRLYRYGFLERRAAYGQPNLYYLSKVGKQEIGGQNKVAEKDFSNTQVPHTLAVNRLLARLLAGKTTELAQLGLKGKLAPNSFISEPDLLRIIEQEHYRLAGTIHETSGYATMRRNKLGLLNAYAEGKTTVPPERSGNDWIFGVFPSDAKLYHYPDAVVKQKRADGDETGACLAIEVELNGKTQVRYEKILKDYMNEFSGRSVYRQVIWLVANESIKKGLERARKTVGLAEKLCPVVLIDEALGD